MFALAPSPLSGDAQTASSIFERLREAYGHLGAALIQALPSDDQIIIGHIQSAHDILKAELLGRQVVKQLGGMENPTAAT